MQCLLYCQQHVGDLSAGLKHLLLELIPPEAAKAAGKQTRDIAVQLFAAYCTPTDAKLAAKVGLLVAVAQIGLTMLDVRTSGRQLLDCCPSVLGTLLRCRMSSSNAIGLAAWIHPALCMSSGSCHLLSCCNTMLRNNPTALGIHCLQVANIFQLTREDLSDWQQLTAAVRQMLTSQSSYKAAVHLMMQFEVCFCGVITHSLCTGAVTSIGMDEAGHHMG
jgi:hypothetical protein